MSCEHFVLKIGEGRDDGGRHWDVMYEFVIWRTTNPVNALPDFSTWILIIFSIFPLLSSQASSLIEWKSC